MEFIKQSIGKIIMIRLRQNYESHIVFFKFFASKEFPGCFWYTTTSENHGFNLGKITDYTPMNITWEEIRKNEKISNF